MTCSGKNIYHTTITCFQDLKAKVILDLKLLYPSSTNPAKLQADRRAQKCHYWAFFHLLQSEFWINWLLILLFGELPSYLSFLPMTHCSILPIFDLSTFWVQVYQTVVYLHLPVRTIFNGTEMHFLTVQNWIHIKTMMAIVMKFGLHSTNWVTDRRTDYALSTCSFSRYPATMKFHSRIPWYPRLFFAFSKSWSACSIRLHLLYMLINDADKYNSGPAILLIIELYNSFPCCNLIIVRQAFSNMVKLK